jgi:hypothetical protein
MLQLNTRAPRSVSYSRRLLLSTAFAQAPPESPFPPDSEIRQILASRVGRESLGIAMVVGTIDSKGRRVVAYMTFRPQ